MTNIFGMIFYNILSAAKNEKKKIFLVQNPLTNKKFVFSVLPAEKKL